MDQILEFFQSPDFGDKLFTYTTQLVGAILALIIGFWIANRVSGVAGKAMEKSGLDLSLRKFLTSLISVLLKVLVLVTVAQIFGVDTTAFVAAIGGAFFAIGLALQGSLGHFASGVLILIFRPYKVGDLVEIGGGNTGTVEEIQVFNTVLLTLDNKKIIVPNGNVTSNVITNISGQGIIGVELMYGIGYSDDIDKAREIILQVGKACPFVLDDPAQGVVVAELGDSSVNLATRPFAKSENYWDTYFYMQENVKKEFDKAGINIPFPQMDVHINQN